MSGKRAGKGARMIRGIAAVLLLTLLAGSSYYLYTLETGTCGICQRPLHGATTYRIDLRGENSWTSAALVADSISRN